jgi:hypothetical protein
MSTVGSPWPGAVHGEVYSPTGRRAYLAADAAALAARSVKWATTLARGGAVESESGLIPGRAGGRPAWFLLADSFENHLSADPDAGPPASATPQVDLNHLLQLQGADLEAARREIDKLTQTVTQLNAERNQLLDTIAGQSQTIASLTQIAKTTHTP